MFLFSIKGHSITASFRVPETHTSIKHYHYPKDCAYRMMGAAIGLNMENALEYAEQNEILVECMEHIKG